MKICSNCVLDTSVPEIDFDNYGKCNYCYLHEDLISEFPIGRLGINKLKVLIAKIRRTSKSDYDCVVGVSGGVDSTYTLYLAKKFGLRPLAVHVDNGWNSELAVNNIEKITKELDIDLHTIVLDWPTFREIQLAFLRASVPDGEIPTDLSIQSGLFAAASEFNIKYIINGHNFRAQGTCPIGWTYMDGKYLTDVSRRFSEADLNKFPNLNILNLIYYSLFKRVKTVSLLEYMDYDRNTVTKFLTEKLGWRAYGGKHYESTYTKFFQGFILMEKFGIDKRKIHLSSQIRSGKIDRTTAIKSLKDSPFDSSILDSEIAYVTKKFRISIDDFNKIISSPIKSFRDYKSYFPLIQLLSPFIYIFCKLGFLPMRFYKKYATDVATL